MDIKKVAATRYTNIRDKCGRKTHPDYWKFGAKGIKMCPEWLNSFQAFYQWAINNKLTESKFIFRRNEDEDYSPENCFVGTKDEYASHRGWKSYSYNDLHQLSGVLYSMPDLSIEIIVVEDDAFIDRQNLKKFFEDESIIKRINEGAAKLEKENQFYHFKKDILLNDGTTKKSVSRFVYNSDDLQAIKPYVKDLSELDFMKYSELISILEEWNDHTVFKVSLAPPAPAPESNKEEEVKAVVEIKETIDRNSTVEAPDKVELLTALLSMCSDKEKSMPLVKLIKLAKIDAEIESLKVKKANIIKE